jgi:ATP-dependent DNA helicase RecQ
MLLGYFGENYTEPNCDGCDVCFGDVEMVDQSLPAQKLLSSVIRASQLSPVSFGLVHHSAILRGDETEAITRWGHNALSTFGIGKELTSAEWSRLGRSLAVRGLLAVGEGQYSTVSITSDGIQFLKTRPALLLPKKRKLPEKKRKRSGSPFQSVDDSLFERLRALRLELAKAKNVPAYHIFGDATLQEMALRRPQSEALNKQLARKRPKNTPFDIHQVALHYWSISNGSRIRENFDAVLVTGVPSACGEVF